jgi:hypothetical protein
MYLKRILMNYFITFLLIFLAHSTIAQSNSFRLIYLFAPTAQDTNLVKQQRILAADIEGIKERDLRISVILMEHTNTMVYKKYKVPTNKFTFLLIGKDGLEKIRAAQVFSLQKLFTLIDGMPMRQDEMQQRKLKKKH